MPLQLFGTALAFACAGFGSILTKGQTNWVPQNHWLGPALCSTGGVLALWAIWLRKHRMLHIIEVAHDAQSRRPSTKETGRLGDCRSGWNWRKAFRFGPLRVNLSKKGVGYSVGVRGFRVGRDAKRQDYSQTSIPGTGIYKRTYSGRPSREKNWSVLALIALFLLLLLAKLLLK